MGLPSNISKWLRGTATAEQDKSAKLVSRWAEKSGSRISGGTSIGKSPQALVLDIRSQQGEIYVSPEGSIKAFNTYINSYSEFVTEFNTYKNSSEDNKKYFDSTKLKKGELNESN
jgi:hypothetical protein